MTTKKKYALHVRSTAIRRVMMLELEKLTPIVIILWLVLLRATLPVTDGRERKPKDKRF